MFEVPLVRMETENVYTGTEIVCSFNSGSLCSRTPDSWSDAIALVIYVVDTFSSDIVVGHSQTSEVHFQRKYQIHNALPQDGYMVTY
jgi:hypothetical protein